MLEPLVDLFSSYSSVPETCALLLELLVDLTTNVANRLDVEGQAVLCATAVATVQAHMPNMERLRGAAHEEAAFAEHALLMVRLLSALSSAQQFGGETSAESDASPGDVVITGLEQLLPMLTEEYLSEPQLCQKYFSLVLFLAQEFSGELYAAGDLCDMVLSTIAHGIGPYGTDITRFGLEALHFIGSTHYDRLQEGSANPDLVEPLQGLLEALLQMFLLEPFDLRLEQSAARALFPIVCADQECFQHLAEALLVKQENSELRDRLADALDGLLTGGGLTLHVDRANQATFTANFKELLSAVRGFILTH